MSPMAAPGSARGKVLLRRGRPLAPCLSFSCVAPLGVEARAALGDLFDLFVTAGDLASVS